MKFTSKIQLERELKFQLATRDSVAIKGLITIYNNQTETEKNNNSVVSKNNIGFVPSDAEFCSSLVKNYNRYKKLTDMQMIILHKIMPKYAGQLLAESFSKGLIVKDKGEYKFDKKGIK